QGRCEEAEPLYQRCLSIDEKVYGPDHPEVPADLNNNWARLLEIRWRADQPLSERSQAIRDKVLGPEHAEVAQSLNNQALLLRCCSSVVQLSTCTLSYFVQLHHAVRCTQGKYAEAEPLYERCQAGKYTAAEPLYARAQAIVEKVLGPEHPSLAATLNNRAGLLRSQERCEEAEPLYQRCLSIDENIYGPAHPEVAADLNNLAVLLESRWRTLRCC
ncbi:unnamed protein product, partial [Scytosiphon promiscuus]